MSFLSNVKKGKIAQPFLGLLYGTDGIGKSTFGAAMPAPLFLGPESGTANLDVARLSVSSYGDFLAILKELLDKDHTYQSLVIDSLDWLEPLVWEHLIASHNSKGKGQSLTSIEDFGYGKGFQFAVDEWRKTIPLVTALREKKRLNVLFIAHAHSKDAKDPTVQNDYNRYQLKLQDKAAALFREFVDCVFFANFETYTAVDAKKKVRAYGDGARYIFTERRPAFDAKNRFGLPFQMPLDWEQVREAIESSNPEDPSVIEHNIELMIDEVTNETAKAQMLAKLEEHRGNLEMLKRLENKIKTVVNAPAA